MKKKLVLTLSILFLLLNFLQVHKPSIHVNNTIAYRMFVEIDPDPIRDSVVLPKS